MIPRIGTAGWSVPRQWAQYFPADGSHLQRYAARLPAVEINSSFHRPHLRTTYERWAASVPDDFRFAVKLPRAITHDARLRDCAALARAFAEQVAGLGGKLAVVLVQTPPTLPFDAAIVGDFLGLLRDSLPDAVTPACEPRHPSWFTPAAEALLVECRAARVAADPAPVPAAASPGGWVGLAYYRLHGSPSIYYSGYDAETIVGTARHLAFHIVHRVPTWCIFDNTAAFAATGNALALLDQTR